ncbi:hypothetical protein [Actinokineospora alba]|uniref:hypothetical protein n=1 Tax=Actinokineospora alba TaxID=504798 RepID=UPI001E50823E|nr:hypothetical protein [Actinokineospora alba]
MAAVIAAEALFRTIGELTGTKIVPIAQGLALLPITDDFFDSVTDPTAPRDPDFWKLPCGFTDRLATWSQVGPTAYVEAEYFGGVGSQTAAVWIDGTIVFGPLHLAEDEPTPTAGTPISQALRHLGVRQAGKSDEFDAAGLGRHRHLKDWLD